MDPTQNLNLESDNPAGDQQSTQMLQNTTNQTIIKSNLNFKNLFFALLIFLLLLIIFSLSFLLFSKPETKIEDAKSITTTGEFEQYRKDFASSILLKPVSFMDYDNTENYRILNTEPNIEDVVRISCSNWEPAPNNPNQNVKNGVSTLNIVYGVIGRGDFWSASFIKEDLEIGKTYYLPIYLDDRPAKYGRLYINSDSKEFDSGSYNAMGLVKINKFEGCDLGDEIEFEINAVLGQNEENEDVYYELEDESKGMQLIGQFQGKVNIENGKSAYDILIPDEEFKAYLATAEKAKKDRLERLKNEYIDEYGYDEEYDYFFDDESNSSNTGSESAQKRDTQRQSNITQILNAIGAYAADNSGLLPSGISNIEEEIATDGADICSEIVSAYIPSLPVDPDFGESWITNCDENYETGYAVSKESNGRVTVTAVYPETEDDISITR